MKIVLGVDPGSIKTGFGLIIVEKDKLKYLDSGCIRMKQRKITDRLKVIYKCMREIIKTHHPDQAAVEQVFMHTNAGSALKLGQARGAAITAIVQDDIPVAEYSARQIKQSVVGTGAAEKSQVQHMIKTLLNLSDVPSEDAADALAVAICHSNSQKSLQLMHTPIDYKHRRLQ